jgi:hypothetical protein
MWIQVQLKYYQTTPIPGAALFGEVRMEEKSVSQWEALFCNRYPFESYNEACDVLCFKLLCGNTTKKFMKDRVVLLGGRFYANIKADHEKRQLANCFALDVEDDRDAWADHLGRVARLTLFGGGVGTDYSKLRPEGAVCTSTPGLLAGGPCSLIRATDVMTKELKSCRRGALLAQLQWDHPDFDQFIDLKEKTEDRSAPPPLERTNISGKFDERWHDIIDAGVEHAEYGKARSALTKVLLRAVTRSEPGIAMNGRTRARGETPFGHLMNPCQPARAKVRSREGIITFGDLEVGMEIWDGWKFVKVIRKIHTGVRPVYMYITKNGCFIGTQNHRLFTSNGKVEAWEADDVLCEVENGVLEFQPIDVCTHIGEMDVFDISVDSDEHVYWTDGCIVSNCGELRAESDGACCNIGTLFLYNALTPSKLQSMDELITTSVEAGKRIIKLLMRGGQISVLKDESARKRQEIDNRLLIGFGGSAMLDAVLGRESLRRLLTSLTTEMRKYAKVCADMMDLPEPVALFGCAPNGTTGIIAECCGGIEFPFAEAYVRNIADQKGFGRPKQHVFVDSGFERVYKDFGVKMRTAQTVGYEDRLEWQAFMQDFCDMGISSTINLPKRGEPGNDMEIDKMVDILLKYHRRLAGVTFYADGSIEGQPLTAIPFDEARKLIGDSSSAVLEDNDSLIALSNLICRGGTCGV